MLTLFLLFAALIALWGGFAHAPAQPAEPPEQPA
jgi:hypothetical protein